MSRVSESDTFAIALLQESVITSTRTIMTSPADFDCLPILRIPMVAGILPRALLAYLENELVHFSNPFMTRLPIAA